MSPTGHGVSETHQRISFFFSFSVSLFFLVLLFLIMICIMRYTKAKCKRILFSLFLCRPTCSPWRMLLLTGTYFLVEGHVKDRLVLVESSLIKAIIITIIIINKRHLLALSMGRTSRERQSVAPIIILGVSLSEPRLTSAAMTLKGIT